MIPGGLLLQVSEAIPTSPWEMIRHASLMAQIVLVVLVVLSLISWAIMILKWREFRRVLDAGHTFMRDFERSSSLDDASALARRAPPSPFTRVFSRGVNFFAEMKPGALRSTEHQDPLRGSQVEALRMVLDAETTHERERMGHFIPWLATIGSVSPLIGLLGTVLVIGSMRWPNPAARMNPFTTGDATPQARAGQSPVTAGHGSDAAPRRRSTPRPSQATTP